MLLAIDIGNTNVTLGGFDGKTLRFMSRISTDTKRTPDQYAVELLSILRLYHIEPGEISGTAISSVVPALIGVLCEAIEKITGARPLVVGPGIKTGLHIKIDNPAQLGADLVVGAVAAIARYPLPCIVFDFGTATKSSVIGADGSFLGATISAGIGISIEALAMRTAQLPYISIEAPPRIIGTNTIDSMKSGIVVGTAAMVDGLACRIEDELGSPATLVATGGLGRQVAACCRREIIFTDTLILEGLRIIFEKNNPNS